MLAFCISLAAAAFAVVAAVGTSPAAAAAVEIEVLDLPDDFDLSHPALDIEHQIKMMKALGNRYVPSQLLDNLPIKNFHIHTPAGGFPNPPLVGPSPGGKAAAAAAAAGSAADTAAAAIPASCGPHYICQNLDPPGAANALAVANSLSALKLWCCQTKKLCTSMYGVGNAAAAICSVPKRCVRCSRVGSDLKELIQRCETGDAVAGYVSYGPSVHAM